MLGCDRWPWESKNPASATSKPSGSSVTPSAESMRIVPASERVAQVNQIPISTTDMELAIQELKRFAKAYGQEWKPLPVQDKPDALDLPDVLNNLVDGELKAQDAKARGLDHTTDVARRFAYLSRSFWAQEWDRWQREHAAPSDEEIRQFYDKNKAGFIDPERVKIRQIVTPSLSEAEAARARVVQGTSFDELARQVSIGAGKEQGGDVGWYLRAIDHQRLRLIGANPTEAVFFPQLEPVAFALEIGQVSQPVKGPDGRYYIVQVDERRIPKQQTELEVHDSIKELLTLQSMQQQLDQLRKKASVEMFTDRLETIAQ